MQTCLCSTLLPLIGKLSVPNLRYLGTVHVPNRLLQYRFREFRTTSLGPLQDFRGYGSGLGISS